MKLLTKINRSYLKYSLLVFLLADIAIIAVANYFLKEELDQQLRLEAKEIFEVLKEKGEFQSIYPTEIVTPIPSSEIRTNIKKDTLILDLYQNELTPYREFTYYPSINNKYYRITTRQMLMEFDDIFTIFTTLISVVLVLIFIGLLLFTNRLNSSIWKTFNNNLEKIKSYSFAPPSKLELAATGINEFDDLNEVLLLMSNRLEKDYTATKEFSVNAAHELQTPLAIIRNKCENLFSNTELNKETIATLRDIYLSTNKLSGITQALLLLAKIDHGQFNEKNLVSFNENFKNWIDSFHDVILDRKLNVSISATDNCKLLMDKRLANILTHNIFINAIKHSTDGQNISISLSRDQFSVSNYGEKPINQPEKIFNRFYKESQSNSSTGIGLAIVKKIADHYKITIVYSFKDFNHIFTFHLNNC